MITLKKSPDKDFIIMNISDPQLGDDEWNDGAKNREILTNTFAKVMDKVHPDLITVSGDLAWSHSYTAYNNLADMIDSYGIPWAPVWGNHDNEAGPENVEILVDIMKSRKNCIYESGDPTLGNGNYVIAIEEDGKIVEGVIMMDSHDRVEYINPQGEVDCAWAKVTPEQIDWYKDQVKSLKDMGCTDTTVIMHIPIYAYKEAATAAIPDSVNQQAISVEDSYKEESWNEGYKNSFGVRWEGICSYPYEDGMMDAILEAGTTKHVISGHDHTNNFVIEYKGVKLIYSMKIGAGCYWTPKLNGATVLAVTTNGVENVHHEYVNDYIK